MSALRVSEWRRLGSLIAGSMRALLGDTNQHERPSQATFTPSHPTPAELLQAEVRWMRRANSNLRRDVHSLIQAIDEAKVIDPQNLEHADLRIRVEAVRARLLGAVL